MIKTHVHTSVYDILTEIRSYLVFLPDDFSIDKASIFQLQFQPVHSNFH